MGSVRIRRSMEEVDSLMPFASSEQQRGGGGVREERRGWWEPEDPEESKNLPELQPVDQLKRPRGDKDLGPFCCGLKSLCGSLLVVMLTGSLHNCPVMPLIGTVARRPPCVVAMVTADAGRCSCGSQYSQFRSVDFIRSRKWSQQHRRISAD